MNVVFRIKSKFVRSSAKVALNLDLVAAQPIRVFLKHGVNRHIAYPRAHAVRDNECDGNGNTLMLMLRCSAWRYRRGGRRDERRDGRRDERCDGLRDGPRGCLELLLHRQLIPLLGCAILSPSRRNIRDGGLLLLPLRRLSSLMMTWRLLHTMTLRSLLVHRLLRPLLVRMVKRLQQLR